MSKGKFEIADVVTADTALSAPNWALGCAFDICPPLALIHNPVAPPTNVLFLTFFIAVFLPQLFLGIKHRNDSFTLALITCLILEIIGYVCRIQLTTEPFLRAPFLLSLVCLTLGPVFVNGAIAFFFGRLAVAYDYPLEGRERVIKIRNAIVFFTCIGNLASLAVEAVGCVFIALAEDWSSVSSSIQSYR
jgi:RTA1 like protein